MSRVDFRQWIHFNLINFAWLLDLLITHEKIMLHMLVTGQQSKINREVQVHKRITCVA